MLSEAALVHIPRHLSFENATSLPCSVVNARVAMTGIAGLSGATLFWSTAPAASRFLHCIRQAVGRADNRDDIDREEGYAGRRPRWSTTPRYRFGT